MVEELVSERVCIYTAVSVLDVHLNLLSDVFTITITILMNVLVWHLGLQIVFF